MQVNDVSKTNVLVTETGHRGMGKRHPAIQSVATAVPPDSYSQQDILTLFSVEDSRIRSLFLKSAIDYRHLVLPSIDQNGVPALESQGQLLDKHLKYGVLTGKEAILRCLDRAEASPDDVMYLCCVSSTGFIAPGLSARLIKELELPVHCARLDVVGMGCNAGLNALAAVVNWSIANPNKLAVMACIEVCSAAYVFDGTMRTSVVNSLFGDGAAALAIRYSSTNLDDCPQVLDFSSHIIPDAIEAMRYDWDEEHGKFSFFLDPQIPYVVGAHVENAVDRLLSRTGVRKHDITHWIVHSGGKKVIDAIRVNLGLTRHDMRNTLGVLRSFGNVSSASFLFSYERLVEERVTRPGELGVMMTMGPGSTIETALLKW